MKIYNVTYVQFGTVTQGQFEADHYSVSSANNLVAHFYRKPEPGTPAAVSGKDELIGSVASEGALVVKSDDEAVVIEKTIGELDIDLLLDDLADHLGLPELVDDDKVRVTVRKI